MRIHLRVDRIVLFDLVLFQVADDDDKDDTVLDLVADHTSPPAFGFAPDEEEPDGD